MHIQLKAMTAPDYAAVEQRHTSANCSVIPQSFVRVLTDVTEAVLLYIMYMT